MSPQGSGTPRTRELARSTQHLDLLCQPSREAIPFDVEVVGCLEIEPESVRRPEEPGEAGALSAVTARLPSTISLMRRGGTLRLLARRYWDSPRGFQEVLEKKRDHGVFFDATNQIVRHRFLQSFTANQDVHPPGGPRSSF